MDTRCKNCGAPLYFDTKTHNVFCKSCGSTFFNLNEKSKLKESEKECVFCGGKYNDINPLIVTQKCPFCNQKTIINRRVNEFRGFLVLPYNYYYNEAKEILLKKIPPYRNKKYVKKMLEEDSKSLYVPFHSYNLYIEGTFTWQCSKTEQVEDGKDSEGNTKYKTVTETWVETHTADYDFNNASIVSSNTLPKAFELTKRTYKKLTFKNEDLENLEHKYFLMSKYLFPSDRSDRDTFQDFIDYAFDFLKDMSSPANADYLISYHLSYNPLLVYKDRYEVLIPFYWYRNKKEQKYYCYVNAFNGEVKYKCPLNVLFILFLVFLGIIVTGLIIFLFVYLIQRSN